MVDYEDIRLERDGGVAFLVIDRPEQNNAVRPQTLAELCGALDRVIADDDVRAIVLRAEGKHFCAGAEFGWLDTLPTTPSASVQGEIYKVFQGAARRLYGCPKPTIALVNGFAVTVGCELSLACDFRIAADNARFQESWIKLGLMPPLGGLFLLPRIVGLARASAMVLRGTPVAATEALTIGLVNEIVAPEALLARGHEMASELGDLPPLAYASVKQALHRGLESGMEAEWTANVFNQAVLLSTDDFKEGLAAVRERRAGAFSGR